MIFKLELKADASASLPLAYNSLQQGVIYDLISSREEYSDFLHDEGYSSGRGAFKAFCFGPLQGASSVNRVAKTIAFRDKIKWEIRSSDPEFCEALLEGLQRKKSLSFGGCEADIISCEAMEADILSESLLIRMRSPLVVYDTQVTDGISKTIYHDPLDADYEKMIDNNFRHKYLSVHGWEPSGGISLAFDRITAADKCVTHFRNTWITGWRGIYRLKGHIENLVFVYETGLGVKNSEGFGMFDVVDRR